MAPMIASVIDEIDPSAVVADAFAGTCAVASAVCARHAVITNDIHRFAEIVAKALLVGTPVKPKVATALSELRQPFLANRHALHESIQDRLSRERRALTLARSGGRWRDLVELTRDELTSHVPLRLQGLKTYSTYARSRRATPYALFSMLFASTYFGIKQAAEIDSLRYAIDQAPSDRWNIYMLALLQAASHCSASPGHFAQFLVPRDAANCRYIARIRQRSVLERFFASLTSLELPDSANRSRNAVFRMEASDFVVLLPDRVEGQLIIYADPPYSRAQYSRYYHVLETLVRYDYPAATGKGRYRPDRFNTDFSRSAQVVMAMNNFVQAAALTGAPLLLSYPRNGLMTPAQLMSVCEEHYPSVTVRAAVPATHSTLGAAPGVAQIPVMEDLYYARWE